jgi:restriction system protein
MSKQPSPQSRAQPSQQSGKQPSSKPSTEPTMLIRLAGRLPGRLAALFGGTAAGSAQPLGRMPWRDVQHLIGEAYRRRGYEVRDLAGASSPAGADLMLIKATQRLLVVCQQWHCRKLRERPVRELYGAMAAQGATGGMLINAGTITPDAWRFAGLGRIEIIDVPRLVALLRREEGAREAVVAHAVNG